MFTKSRITSPQSPAQYGTLGVWVVLEVEVELVQKEICQSTKSRNIYLEISANFMQFSSILCNLLSGCQSCSKASLISSAKTSVTKAL